MFVLRDSLGPVELAFTDRHGGTSAGPFASLDLSSPLAADVDGARGRLSPAPVVEANLDQLLRAFSADPAAGERPGSARSTPPTLVRLDQVHGADVTVVDESRLASLRAGGEVPVGDALVTALPGVVLLVRVADCVPVILADGAARVVAAVHAGRPGLVAGVVPAAVAAMRALGADRIHAWLGPSVCGACYEVPAPMRAQVAAAVPAAWSETSWGTPSVDVAAGVRAQLDAAGAVTVTAVEACTVEDPDLFSYRRQGADSGRLGALVWVRP